MAPQSSTLAWKIPWTEEPGGLQSMGSLRVGHDWVTSLSLFTFMHWRRQWQPTPVFLPGESQGRGSLVSCRFRSPRVRHDWSDLAAAAAAVTKQQQHGTRLDYFSPPHHGNWLFWLTSLVIPSFLSMMPALGIAALKGFNKCLLRVNKGENHMPSRSLGQHKLPNKPLNVENPNVLLLPRHCSFSFILEFWP